jgi:hypothetical protein
MELWLQMARGAAALNILLLVVLGTVWIRNYRSHRARHTLGLIVFAAVLLLQNVLWLYLYLVHPEFIGWFVNAGTDIQISVTMLCGLELVALAFLTRITWL